MGRMKDKFIEEQEKISLDSLYDAKYYEVKDMEYELYLNSEQYFDDIEAQADEDAFINELVERISSLSRVTICLKIYQSVCLTVVRI